MDFTLNTISCLIHCITICTLENHIMHVTCFIAVIWNWICNISDDSHCEKISLTLLNNWRLRSVIWKLASSVYGHTAPEHTHLVWKSASLCTFLVQLIPFTQLLLLLLYPTSTTLLGSDKETEIEGNNFVYLDVDIEESVLGVPPQVVIGHVGKQGATSEPKSLHRKCLGV